MENEFEDSLKQVVELLLERADSTRQQTNPWKELWEQSENGLRSVIDKANDEMTTHALNLADVICKRFQIRCSNRLWDLICALPYAFRKLEKGIEEKDGISCVCDKTRLIYYQEVLAEINLIKGNETHGCHKSNS